MKKVTPDIELKNATPSINSSENKVMVDRYFDERGNRVVDVTKDQKKYRESEDSVTSEDQGKSYAGKFGHLMHLESRYKFERVTDEGSYKFTKVSDGKDGPQTLNLSERQILETDAKTLTSGSTYLVKLKIIDGIYEIYPV